MSVRFVQSADHLPPRFVGRQTPPQPSPRPITVRPSSAPAGEGLFRGDIRRGEPVWSPATSGAIARPGAGGSAEATGDAVTAHSTVKGLIGRAGYRLAARALTGRATTRVAPTDVAAESPSPPRRGGVGEGSSPATPHLVYHRTRATLASLPRWTLTTLRRHLALVLVLLAFAATTLIIPTLTQVATTDDWGYTRSVEILLNEGRLTVLPAVAATAVFQILWGALFGLAFGMSLAMMRIATLVMVALGAVALYALCRDLGVSKGRSALGTAVWLFNPLTFVLSYTFMTDPYFTSLLIISTAFYVHGIHRLPGPDAPGSDATASPAGRAGPARAGSVGAGDWSIIAGSAVAGCAFLTRQQGALIPVAVVLFLIAGHHLWPSRRRRDYVRMLLLLLRVGGLTALMLVGYSLWLALFNSVTSTQETFFREAVNAGLPGTWELLRNVTYIEVAYMGMLTLPIVLAGLVALPRAIGRMTTAGWIVLSTAIGAFFFGLATYLAQDHLMPYVQQFIIFTGLGPPDVLGAPPTVMTGDIRRWLTMATVIGVVLLLVLACNGIGRTRSVFRSRAGLVVAMFIIQVIGILPPSYHYLHRGYSLDRYLLPLLPLTIVLLLWSLRDRMLLQPLGWLLIAAAAVYSVMGTRDYLVYLHAVWNLAAKTEASGVPLTQIDAGAAWDGYHLYTDWLANPINPQTPHGPWWVYYYGVSTDSTFVVSGRHLDGYDEVSHSTYSSWLLGESPPLYLLRRSPGST